MTTEVYLAIIAAVVTLGTLYLNRNNDKRQAVTNEKLDTIHILVNSRMTTALAKIRTLEEQIAKLTGEPTPPPADPVADVPPTTP